MKDILFIAILTILLQACASPSSPYISDCSEPECEQQAIERSLETASAGTVKVVIDTKFSFETKSSAKELIHQADTLVITFPDDTRVAAASLSVEDFGLVSSEFSAYGILNLAFMEKFSMLPDSLSQQEKHVIRSIKIDAMSTGEAVRYVNDNITIYFYSESEVKHKAYVVAGRETTSWNMLDFYGLTVDEVQELLSTIQPF